MTLSVVIEHDISLIYSSPSLCLFHSLSYKYELDSNKWLHSKCPSLFSYFSSLSFPCSYFFFLKPVKKDLLREDVEREREYNHHHKILQPFMFTYPVLIFNLSRDHCESIHVYDVLCTV